MYYFNFNFIFFTYYH